MNHKTKVLVLGGVIIDNYYLVEKYANKGTDQIIKESFKRIGGCAVNVAFTLKNLNVLPLIVSKIGSGPNGNFVKEYLDSYDFCQSCIQIDEEKDSGFSICIIDSAGERTFYTKKGCEGDFTDSLLLDKATNDIEYIYLTGYYLLNHQVFDLLCAKLTRLVNKGAKLVFDPGPLIGEVDNQTLKKILSITNIITPNQKEAIIMEKRQGILDFKKWAFKNFPIEKIVLKKGDGGVSLYTKYAEPTNYRSYTVDTIDTTGAGDSFAGGVLYGVINGLSNREILMYAQACGALTTTHMGPHLSFTLKDIKNLINKEGDSIVR